MSEPFIREASTSSFDYPQVLPATASSADYLFLAFSFTAPVYRAPRSAGHWQLQQHFLFFFFFYSIKNKKQKVAFSILLQEVTFVQKIDSQSEP